MNPLEFERGFSQIARGTIRLSNQLLQTTHRARPGWLLLTGMGALVFAFIVLSLAITATGTARFAVAMNYPAVVGYAVGGIFDFAKEVLPVGLLVLFRRRSFILFAILGSAWLGLVTYSCLATHATVSTAIATIERNGSWKMEGRTNSKAALAAVEQRLTVLSQPTPPRPSNMLGETLAAERVPPGVWEDSRECQKIRASKYFQTACARILDLRRELAAAEDYEKLEGRAKELRQALASAPVVAISDPLPDSFAATLGRVLPLDGHVGVALLLTLVIEIISCFGLAALRALREGAGREELCDRGRPVSRSRIDEGRVSGRTADEPIGAAETAPNRPSQIVPLLSLEAARTGVLPYPASARDDQAKTPSNVVPLTRAKQREPGAREASTASPSSGTISKKCNHVPEFVRECLQSATGKSLSASELRARYEVWCAARDLTPLSLQKLGAELTRLGYAKWKSCGLIRYRDLQLAA